jgi:activating signal cointegrator complex subunit 3
MEAALLRLEAEQKVPSGLLLETSKKKISAAVYNLAIALEAVLPLLDSSSSRIERSKYSSSAASSTANASLPNEEAHPLVSAEWLIDLCATVPSAMEPSHLARAIWDAGRLSEEANQQAALFDALGESEQAMDVLMQVAPRLADIRLYIRQSELVTATKTTTTTKTALEAATRVDLEEERRELLRNEALEAAQVAAMAQAQVMNSSVDDTTAAGATHTVVRQSDKRARKYADKAAKRAAVAMERAKQAGAVLDEAEFISMHQFVAMGDGGLMNRSQQQVWELQQSLLPEGSRQYHDNSGLPDGAQHVQEDGVERVLIPAARRDEANLHPRLRISEIMDPDMAKAFQETSSLNPMQSTVFEAAFKRHDNLLICAPTGAGKTNVAMLTVVAHFRNVGLIGRNTNNAARLTRMNFDHGKKVIYIAPMKALAQEVVEKFSSKLTALGLMVRELTGDMQLTRAQSDSAHVIVTTPEKWDVVTRKSGTDERSLGNKCGLLIIDEVHLLADERGAVIESVVSRLHRLVESRQRTVRIVALSATLPNYQDVAEFLKVPDRGLFFFGPEHRPVPLQQQFIGVGTKRMNRNLREEKMNSICFETVLDSLQRGYQVMVFVHSRKGTGDTARALADIAASEGVLEKYFVTAGKEGPNGDAYKLYSSKVKKSPNREVGFHFANGIGIHHAGMLRNDRKLVERMFNDGAIKVLCCTATLAWGINLPAHTVVIKGTDVYAPEKGGNVDLSILDVQQIFGRAGRPQFDTSGEATLITTLEAFPRYMNKLVRPVPIESNFAKQLGDHLNAEVAGRTVTTLNDAAQWLTYTYMYVRMRRNPLAYGISTDEFADDPSVRKKCLELVTEAAKMLDHNNMIAFDARSGNLSSKEVGRISAHFYVQAESVETFNEMFKRFPVPTYGSLCRVVCSATEFRNMKVREEELDELQDLAVKACPLPIMGTGFDEKGRTLITDPTDKAFVLLQTFISREKLKSFTLVSDMNYIISSAARIGRSLFEMSLKDHKMTSTTKLLSIAKSIEKRIWWFQSPLRHFEDELGAQVYSALEITRDSHYDAFEYALSLADMPASDVGKLCKSIKDGSKIQTFVSFLPRLAVTCDVYPVTSAVLRFKIEIRGAFKWSQRWHGGVQSYWLFVEDPNANRFYHSEHITLSFRNYADSIVLDLPIPVFFESTEYMIRTISDSWVAVEQTLPVSLLGESSKMNRTIDNVSVV